MAVTTSTSLFNRPPQLPWAEGKSESLFNKILIGLLAVTLVFGVLIPTLELPEVKREKLEKLPPQLAKVLKRKKEKPKPKPVAKVKEKIPEKKVEPKKVEAPKPKVVKPKPVAKVVPKPKPKPKKVTKKERTPERIKAAKEKAKKLVSAFSADLADMKSMVDMSALTADSSALTNAGAATTAVGSVVSQDAVARVSGVDESQLTRATGAEQLAEATRDTTQVKELPQEALAAKPQEQKIAGMNRSQMQIRRVFEQSKSRFDRIYRKALRSNPALEGTVTLGVKVAATGEVTDCSVKASELNDSKVEKRIKLTCKMLAFDPASKADAFEYPLTFAP